MNDSLSGLFDDLKISAFSKVKLVNNQIHNVTLGPNSTLPDDDLVDNGVIILTPLQQKPATPKSSPEPETMINTNTAFYNIKNELECRRQETLRKAVDTHVNAIVTFDKQQKVSF